MHDIENISVEYLPFRYPSWVFAPDGRLINKILYKVSLPVLRLLDQGNYYDRSIFWKWQIQRKITEYVKEKNIGTVIVSSGPFRLSYYVAQMKLRFPEVKFIVDYRDLWTEDVEITSFAELPLKRKQIEKIWEKRTAQLADTVITVADKMTAYFDALTISHKTFTIPNGFDEDDFKGLTLLPPAENNQTIRFVFTGTLYRNLGYILTPFFSALQQVKQEDPALYARFEINFLGFFPIEYQRIVNEMDVSECVHVYERVPLQTVYEKINDADFCLLFLNNVYNFSLSTKFCEYISQKKKIVVMANKGRSIDFILQNGLGYWLDPDRTVDSLKRIVEAFDQGLHRQWNSDFDVSKFSLNNLTADIRKHIDDRRFVNDAEQLNIKNLLITFDYELFLGEESGTVENCMIKPTNLVLDILKQHAIKHAIFFIDTSYLIALRAKAKYQACRSDLAVISAQLVDMLKAGHYIFPHIHPHWMDADYNPEKNIWHLNNVDKYRFHKTPAAYQRTLFEESMTIIRDIQQRAGVSYPIDGYRAGGWCLQPFSTFKPYFREFGIRYDFSVLRNTKSDSDVLYYDFTGVPQKQVYPFNEEVNEHLISGEFTEFSITNIEVGKWTKFMNRILLRYLRARKNTNFGDGFSVKTKSQIVAEGIKEKTSQTSIMASIELLTRLNRKYFFNYLTENDYFHFISHPKMLSNHNIKQFDKVISQMKRKYHLITDYKKML